MKALVRFTTLAAIITAATAARAFQFSALSLGTYDQSTFIDSEQVIGQSGTPATLETLTMNLGTHTGVYTSSNGNLDFDFILGSAIPINNGFYYNATWSYTTGSTGAWANMLGGGTFSFGIDNLNGNVWESNTALVGNLTAAPEPAGFALLGIGAFTLLRRRKV